MPCQWCTDPDGVPCYPIYGVGPHVHAGYNGNPMLGATILLPRDQWPSNYLEDPDNPGCGTWWCEHCGDGKPNNCGACGGTGWVIRDPDIGTEQECGVCNSGTQP